MLSLWRAGMRAFADFIDFHFSWCVWLLFLSIFLFAFLCRCPFFLIFCFGPARLLDRGFLLCCCSFFFTLLPEKVRWRASMREAKRLAPPAPLFSVFFCCFKQEVFFFSWRFERQIERYSSLTLLCYHYEGPECERSQILSISIFFRWWCVWLFCFHLPVLAFLSFLLFWSHQIVRSRVFILLFYFFFPFLACPRKSVEEQACDAGSEAIGITSSFLFYHFFCFKQVLLISWRFKR